MKRLVKYKLLVRTSTMAGDVEVALAIYTLLPVKFLNSLTPKLFNSVTPLKYKTEKATTYGSLFCFIL